MLSNVAFKSNLRRYTLESEWGSQCASGRGGQPPPPHGRAVQVDPIKPTLKASGTKRLKLTHVKLLSSFAFKFNLRRYTTAPAPPGGTLAPRPPRPGSAASSSGSSIGRSSRPSSAASSAGHAHSRPSSASAGPSLSAAAAAAAAAGSSAAGAYNHSR